MNDVTEDNLTPAARAERKRQAQRRGQPVFAAVRFTGDEDVMKKKKLRVVDILKEHGKTREETLIDAFEALVKVNKYTC
jgi:hypothetical protein